MGRRRAAVGGMVTAPNVGAGTDPQFASALEQYLSTPSQQQEAPVQQSPEMPPVDSGARVPVQDIVGGFGTLPADQVAAAVSSGKFKLATPEQLQEYRDREYYTGTTRQVVGVAAGALRGATLGGSDVAYRALSPETADELEKIKRYNPGLSTASEIGGMALPLLVSGGTAGLAEGAGGAGMLARGGRMAAQVASAPMRGLSAAGTGVEGLVGRGLAGMAEGGLASRTAASVIPKIAGQATEGAIIGGGQYFSEAALGDKDLRAQELLASMGGGALIGGAFGGGLGLLGAGGRETVRFGKRVSGAGSEEGASLGEMLVGKGKNVLNQAGERFQGVIDANKELLGKQAVDFRLKSLHGGKRWDQSIAAMTPEQKAVVPDILFKDIPAQTGKRVGDVFDDATALGKLLKEEEPKLGGILRSAETDAVKAAEPRGAANVSAAIDQARKEVLPKYDTVAMRHVRKRLEDELDEFERVYSKLDDEGQPISGTARSSLVDLRDERAALGNIARKNYGMVGDTDFARGLDSIRAVFSKQVDTDLARIAPKEIVDAYKLTKARVGAMRTLENAAGEGVSRATTNSTAGFREQLGGHAAGIVGASIGGIPGFVAGEAMGRAAGWVEKRYGSQYAAEVAHMMSKGARISDVAKMTQEEIRRGVSAFVSVGAGSTLAPVAKRAWEGAKSVAKSATDVAVPAVKTTVRTAGRVGSAAGTIAKIETIKALNPTQFADIRHDIQKQHEEPTIITTKVLGTGLQHSHPGIAQSLVQRAALANEFLYSRLPMQATRPSMSGPVLVPPTKDQMREFERYVKAIDDPLSILDDLKEGNLSPQTVMAVKTVYPGIYSDIETQVRIEVAGKKNLPYSKKMALGLLFGSPVDPTLTPEYLQAMRAASASAIPQSGGNASKGPTFPHVSASKVKQPPSLLTRAEKIGQT